MASAFYLIQNQSLTTSQSSITFSSIPQTYTDLCLLVSSNGTATGNNAHDLMIDFNGDNNSNGIYNAQEVTYLDGSVYGNKASSQTRVNLVEPTTGTGGNVFTAHRANVFYYIFGYAGTTYRKNFLADSVMSTNTNQYQLRMTIGNRASSAAITSITLYPQTNSFREDTTFTLYGIKNS